MRVDLSQLRHGRCYPTSHPLGHSPHPMPHPGTPGAGPSGAPPVGGVTGLGPMASAAVPMARPRPASEAGDWVSCGNWAGDAAVPRCAGGPRHAGGDVNPSRTSTLWTPSFRAQVSEAPCAQLALARATAHPPSSPSPSPLPTALALRLRRTSSPSLTLAMNAVAPVTAALPAALPAPEQARCAARVLPMSHLMSQPRLPEMGEAEVLTESLPEAMLSQMLPEASEAGDEDSSVASGWESVSRVSHEGQSVSQSFRSGSRSVCGGGACGSASLCSVATVSACGGMPCGGGACGHSGGRSSTSRTLHTSRTPSAPRHWFDPLYIEDPLRPSNNVGRNCFRIYAIQQEFSKAHQLIMLCLADGRGGGAMGGGGRGGYAILGQLLQEID